MKRLNSNGANAAPAGRLLLDREAFKAQVFARSSGRCVFCGAPAVDAHHILERKLFADGGYYLDNGAAVCETDHWSCETTAHSVNAVRAAAGIQRPLLAPWMDAGAAYDKWGNRIWLTGLRSWGPLEHDTGARKALAAGGVLGLLMPKDYRED